MTELIEGQVLTHVSDCHVLVIQVLLKMMLGILMIDGEDMKEHDITQIAQENQKNQFDLSFDLCFSSWLEVSTFFVSNLLDFEACEVLVLVSDVAKSALPGNLSAPFLGNCSDFEDSGVVFEPSD